MLDGEIRGAVANPALVVQAPEVADGREIVAERAVPEAVTLMGEDVVTDGVRERLLEQPLPARVAQILRRLPLASFSVPGQDPIRDFAGLAVDASAGELMLNAPDPRGLVRELRPPLRARRRPAGASWRLGARDQAGPWDARPELDGALLGLRRALAAEHGDLADRRR